MTRPSCFPLLLLALLTLAPAASPAADPGADLLVLRADADATPAGVKLQTASAEECTVVFELPSLTRRTVEAEGRTYQELTIPGGGLEGGLGMPGLPTFGGLLEVPAGRAVRAEVLTVDERLLTDLLLLPVQPDDAESFVIHPAYADAAERGAVVQLGRPAVMHGRRVVPFVIRPVTYDPAAATARVRTRLEIRFTFDGEDPAAAPAPGRRALPAALARLFDDRVVNASAADAGKSLGGPDLGTYLVVCPDDPAVTAALQPLLDWRRRQGYAVQLATTAQTGTSTASIKGHIKSVYDTADPPLEFVTLVGDHGGAVAIPTWFESLSGYGGEGDHYYAELEGDDVLADVFLGRLSCRSAAELTGIVAKIVSYETAPPTGDPSWYTRASLTADPSQSGTSTIHVSQWLKAQLEGIGFTQVDTFWSGNYATQMFNTVNQGCSIFSYRGYLGVSGFTSGYIDNTNNGGMLPFAIFPTCDSGSWASTTHARNEAFLRNADGGGIGAIGLATIGTHTRYNNCLYNGIGETVINGDDHRLGVAQAGGKLEMFANYQAFEPDRVEIWSVWSSLIGDPATDVRLAPPTALTVAHPAALPVGAGAVPVAVTDGGAPVAGAIVSLAKDGEVAVTAVTDAAGRALLPLPAHTAGSLLVTVWGHDLLPYLGSLTLGSVDRFVDLVATVVDDDATGGSAGDGDGAANPGETLQLDCALLNRGSLLAGAVNATLASDDPYVTVLDGDDAFGDVAGGATVWGAGGFLVAVAADIPADHLPTLTLTAVSGAETWISELPLAVAASDLSAAGTAWSAGATLQPGQSGDLVLTLANAGAVPSSGAAGVLSTTSPWITVTDAAGVFGTIAPGGAADNAADPFGLSVSAASYGGHLAAFTLTVTETGGAVRTVEFTLPVGATALTDPTGPDAYGYYAYDDGDDEPLLAPVYDWVEIDPNHGGAGVSVGLSDFGYEQDDTAVLDLPFTVTYYGKTYDQVAVCSNGWIAMGATTLVPWRNWAIPSAGSPDAMIAPFWDDLSQAGTNQVYAWHDAVNQRFVVQWSRMANRHGGVQNFEVILHDPTAHPTPSGDAAILFQYEAVNNNDTSRGYATVGIQDPAGADGVLYTYYNSYAPGAAPLAPGRAILFYPTGRAAGATCDVIPGSIAATLAPGESDVRTLDIANNGDAGSLLLFSLEKSDPAPPVAGAKNLSGSTLTANTGTYQPGGTMDVVLTASCVSDDQEWLQHIELDLPPGVLLNSATGFSANDPLDYLGTFGDGVLGIWGNGTILDNQQGQATVNLTFADVSGPVEIPYTFAGDNWGSPPHVITGALVFAQEGPQVRVVSPDGGERWGEGEVRDILFDASGGPAAVRIELDRGDGNGWELLADDVPAGAGAFAWTVTAPYSAHCRVRVTDVDDPGLQDESAGEFTIGRDLGWLTLASTGGTVAAGSVASVDLTFDAAGLDEGVYAMDLVVTNTTGSPIVVPVTLTVTTVTAVQDAPARLRLGRNFPNPFNPSTTLAFDLPAPAPVSLHVYDMQGRRVATLQQGELPAGRHSRTWNGLDHRGRPVPSGLFVARLEVGGEVMTRKLVLTK